MAINIVTKKTEWKDGKGHFLMEGTVDFPKKRVTLSEPIDGRAENDILGALAERFEAIAKDYE